MKNFDGYLKLKLGDNYVLLAGGSHRHINDFMLPLNTSPATTISTGAGSWSPLTGRYVFRQKWTDSSTGSDTADLGIFLDGNLTANMVLDGYYYTLSGYKVGGMDNNSVLLAGGGTKALSDFKIGDYLPLSGGTMTGILTMQADINQTRGHIVSKNSNNCIVAINCLTTNAGSSFYENADTTIELIGANPHIDFNADPTRYSDYSWRMIENTAGTMKFVGNTLTDGNAVINGILTINASKTLQAEAQIFNTSSTGVGISFGASESEYKLAYLKYKFATANTASANNRIAFDIYGHDNLLNILGNGNVGISTTGPLGRLAVENGSVALHTLLLTKSPMTDAPIAKFNDRPSLTLAGPYPALVLFSGGTANANHGATISLAGYDTNGATSGTYKSFTIGTPMYNVTFMEIGYGTNENPHLNGMHGVNYTSGGTNIMRIYNTGNIGIGTSINAVSHRLDVRATDSEVLRLSSATNHGRILFFRSTSTLGAMWGTYGPGAYNYFSNEIGKYEMRLYDNGGLKYGYYPSGTMYDILLSLYGGQVIFYKTGYSTNCALVVGGTATNVNSAVCSWMTSMIQIDAGSGGNTLGCGIAFHNPGVSSAGFGYRNSDANNGYFDFSSDDSNWSIRLNANTYAPNYYTTSDARKKQNIHKISDNIKQFEWKETGETSYGFVAQDLEVKHPELVNDDGNMKTVNYNAALSLVVAKLENRVKELEAKLGLETPPLYLTRAKIVRLPSFAVTAERRAA